MMRAKAQVWVDSRATDDTLFAWVAQYIWDWVSTHSPEGRNALAAMLGLSLTEVAELAEAVDEWSKETGWTPR